MFATVVVGFCCSSFASVQARVELAHPISCDFPCRKLLCVSVFKVFRLSLSSNLPPAFSSLINLFYFIQLRGKINYYLFISPMFNNLLTCLSIDFYDHLVIALPKGFCVLFYFLFTAFVFFLITVSVGLLFLSRLAADAAVCTYRTKKNVVNSQFLLLCWICCLY